MKKTLQEIAEYVGGRIVGDASIVISGLDNIEGAGEHDLTFAVDPHIEEAKTCRAAAVMLPEGVADFPKTALYVEEPRAAFARLLELFTPKLQFPTGVSEQAHIGKDVKLGKDVVIMPFAVVDDHAVIGDRVTLYPHTYIGQYAEIEEDTVIYSSATVREHCHVGKRCVIHCSAVIGSDGFGFTTHEGVHTKVPQVGNVVLEDDVEIGAHDGIDRAAMGSTVIGHGTKIDNLVHIGHNCKIGPNCLIVAQTGISGSPFNGEYGAGKAYILKLTEAVACALGHHRRYAGGCLLRRLPGPEPCGVAAHAGFDEAPAGDVQEVPPAREEAGQV